MKKYAKRPDHSEPDHGYIWYLAKGVAAGQITLPEAELALWERDNCKSKQSERRRKSLHQHVKIINDTQLEQGDPLASQTPQPSAKTSV